jgi:AbrB family looped-hinge helix DNA binding protein
MNMGESNIVMNQRGMITIPSKIRKKYNLQPGMHFTILEDEDGLRLIPIEDDLQFRKNLLSHEEVVDILKNLRQKEVELEK